MQRSIFGNYSYLTIGAIVLIAVGIVWVSVIVKIFLVILLIGVCSLEAIKFFMWVGFRQRGTTASLEYNPFVSIHLAIHNEPHEIVIETIRNVLSQQYSNFELLVIDNNTIDKGVWKPVEEFCDAYDNVRFFHLSNWPFYKSGALNFGRMVTAKKARFIFVIDADYVLQNNAIELAVTSVDRNEIALVQFPQAYHCADERHRPLLEEFNHFFDYYCFKANSCYGALATGTLSLINIDALDRVGGWPVNSLTEDAELGSRLQTAGYDIKYVHQIIGKGIAPLHQSDFNQQRKRWIFGNVQTLFKYSINPIRSFRKWVSGVAQLTVWANMLGVPILCLFSCLLLYPFIGVDQLNFIAILSYLSLWIFSLSKYGQMILIHRNRLVLATQTFLVHYSSLSIGAFHWWPVVFGQKRPFVTTSKVARESEYELNLFYPFLHLGLLCVFLIAAKGLLAFSAGFFLILHVGSTLMDCSCRNKNFKNLSTSLKIIS